MPTDAEHDSAYRDNKAFLTSAGGLAGPHLRWAAVVAFYAAVHLVERLAAADGAHNTRHVGNNSRQFYLTGHPRHGHLLSHLTALRAASEIARYDSLTAFSAAFPANTVQHQLIDNYLAAIEAHVTAFFAPPAPPAAGS